MGPISPPISPPLIVVMAYDRPASLARLLASLGSAVIDGPVDVIISIDGGGANQADVVAVASGFRWPHGTVEVNQHDHLGLVEHFHRCGDLTEVNGSAVLLEDDLIVGPGFHRWATAALKATSGDERLAGVCLAAPWFDGYHHLPFEPLLDGSSGFHLQIPWFHGMAWSADMWQRYRRWRRERSTAARATVPIHRSFSVLDGDEWFPDAVRYLVDTDRYYLMPRQANATNSGAAGQHFGQASDFFQVPLEIGKTGPWSITDLDEALAVYDDHLELSPASVKRLCPDLAGLDLTIDLLGVRDPASISTEYVLTVRPVTKSLRSWGTSLRPMSVNLIAELGPVGTGSETGISLAETGAIRTGRLADLVTRERLLNHAARGRPPGLRSVAAATVGSLAGKWLDARIR